MFNLEQAVADWREQMLAVGIKSPVPLEELEIHLCEEIERQTRAGLDPQQAFEISIPKMGHPEQLNREFKKSERTFMKKTLVVLLGVFGVLFGTALILPALAWYRDHGAMPAEHLVPLLIGAAIVLAGLGAAVVGFKKRKA